VGEQHLYVLKIKKCYKIEIKLWLWINTVSTKATFEMMSRPEMMSIPGMLRAIWLLSKEYGVERANREYNAAYRIAYPSLVTFHKENSLPKGSSAGDMKAFVRREVAHLFREYSRHMALRLGPRN